jgi:hypothetical protein
VAPIVVSNHVSFIDPIFYFYELFPSIVSSKSHDSLFLAGTIIRAMQVHHCRVSTSVLELSTEIGFWVLILWFCVLGYPCGQNVCRVEEACNS